MLFTFFVEYDLILCLESIFSYEYIVLTEWCRQQDLNYKVDVEIVELCRDF